MNTQAGPSAIRARKMQELLKLIDHMKQSRDEVSITNSKEWVMSGFKAPKAAIVFSSGDQIRN
ncbi:hypothetical protein [Pseudomonas brenneri]|uniref:hypothetical protein n=1 Tax=Pseudomonas brenneri TaxID=129817 RepID=UPI003BA0F029